MRWLASDLIYAWFLPLNQERCRTLRGAAGRLALLFSRENATHAKVATLECGDVVIMAALSLAAALGAPSAARSAGAAESEGSERFFSASEEMDGFDFGEAPEAEPERFLSCHNDPHEWEQQQPLDDVHRQAAERASAAAERAGAAAERAAAAAAEAIDWPSPRFALFFGAAMSLLFFMANKLWPAECGMLCDLKEGMLVLVIALIAATFLVLIIISINRLMIRAFRRRHYERIVSEEQAVDARCKRLAALGCILAAFALGCTFGATSSGERRRRALVG